MDAPDPPALDFLNQDDQLMRSLHLEVTNEGRRLGLQTTVDYWFAVFLRRLSRFGYFTYGPITIDVRLISEIAERTAPRLESELPYFGEDFVRFSRLVVDELRRTGQRRVDELHLLLAFMRVEEGLPARVFGELGVTREQVEAYARSGAGRIKEVTPAEKLYSPEEAAEYLGIHVQTVRGWIRSGRLKASRLTGQRALRIAASDLQSILEPVDPAEFTE